MAYARRISQVRAYHRANLLWIEYELLPWIPHSFEQFLLPATIPRIVDYDDAVFHRYDTHRSPFVRRVLGHKIDNIMRSSDLVTVGNSYLADRARAAGAANVEILPTVVDVSAYSPLCKDENSLSPRIGWIGSPSTWKEYMAPMMLVFSDLAAQHGARITAVGAGSSASKDMMLDNLIWSEDTEVAMIQDMDIGVMPLTDTPWARGKCGYKLIQYMACGLPVVASPVGVNSEIVEHGVNGFLATSENEWRHALKTLLQDPALRHSMGQSGRRKVEEQYSLQVWGPKVAHLIQKVAA
jgi:glycosyltransferase involved in cell wall biosynthesis